MSDFVCDFVPSICKGEEPKFKGKICLKPMSYEERLDIIETSLMGAEDGDENKKNMSLISFSKEFARNKLKDFFVSSTLVRVEDNYLFDSLDKLKLD
jgi:hypothetical protein